MIKQYKTICGITATLDGLEINDIRFVCEDALLDLAKANAVYPATYTAFNDVMSEWMKRNDEKWIKDHPNPTPGIHKPSLMGTLPLTSLSCMNVQIGDQLFYFDKDQKTMFDLVCAERNN